MTEWRKDPEFSGSIKKAEAQRLKLRLTRIEAGEQGWQGTAWALERLYPHRFARPEVMNQIAIVNPRKQSFYRKGDCPARGGVRGPYWPSGLPLTGKRGLGATRRESCLCNGPAAKQPGITNGGIDIMSNERDCISEYFEAKGVSRGEFEALKRFPDYEELSDGTLMRMEGDKEFRIYCEDSGWLRDSNGGRGAIVTRGLMRKLSEAHDRVMEKLKEDPGYLDRLREKFEKRAP
jgi:hypothetical protein